MVTTVSQEGAWMGVCTVPDPDGVKGVRPSGAWPRVGCTASPCIMMLAGPGP